MATYEHPWLKAECTQLPGMTLEGKETEDGGLEPAILRKKHLLAIGCCVSILHLRPFSFIRRT